MARRAKFTVFILRIALGWYFLYWGISAILDQSWSLVPYISGATLFPQFYNGLLESSFLPAITIIIKVLLLLVGGFMILGFFARFFMLLGIVLALFFYFPLLHFPFVGENHYIIDEHAIVVIALLVTYSARERRGLGLSHIFSKKEAEE